jgi:hypothetical protein
MEMADFVAADVDMGTTRIFVRSHGSGPPVLLLRCGAVRAWADEVQGETIDGGHFFPEEAADQTATAIVRFFRR